MLRRQSVVRQPQVFGRADRCQQGMLRLDLYKQPFRLLLPDGKNEYRTFVGATLSLFTVVIVLIYGSFKIQQLVDLEDYKVQLRQEDDAFGETEKFGFDEGFVVAAGILSAFEWEDESTPVEEVPPEIGAFGFYIKHFSQEAGLHWTKVPTRPCTAKDFDFDPDESNPDSLFLKTVRTRGDVKDFGLFLLCAVN